MRKLVWFTIGFAIACAVGAYLVSGIWLLLLGLFSLVGAAGCLLFTTKKAKPVMAVFLGLLTAFVWMWVVDTAYLSVPRAYDGKELWTSVELSDYGTETDQGITCDGRIILEGKPYRIRLYFYEAMELKPGDTLTGNFRVNYTLADNWSDYFASSGIYLVSHLKNPVTQTAAQSVPLQYFGAQLRQNLTALLDRLFPADTLAFARALLLGDTSLLCYETNTELSVSGIRHVVSVSGLHVSVLCTMLYAALGYRKILTPAIGLPMLLLFAAVAGFTPAVNRACIMQALMMLSFAVKKEYDPPTALAFSCLVILAVNPMTVAAEGFQLSAGCIVGMLLFGQRLRSYLLSEKRLGPAKGNGLRARLVRGVASGISVTLSTMAVTAPLCALYFDTVSLVSILTNLLTLSVTSVAFYGIIAACLAGAVWLPLGKAIAWLTSWLMRYVLWVAKLLSGFPLAAVYTHSDYIVIWIFACYLLLSVWYLSKKKQTLLLLCCMAASLGVAIGLSWLEPRQDSGRFTMLDVGQGQCILVRTAGENYVIDCGGTRPESAADIAAQTLMSQGITHLDGVILTHYDDDHAAGVRLLLTRISTEALYLPNLEDDGTIKNDLVMTHYDQIQWLQPNTCITLADGTLTLLVGSDRQDDNESGLCVLCQLGNCDILITGDRSQRSERKLLERTQLPDIDILVAGHHGSKNSTSDELLEAVQPETVLISVGRNNSYGHPAEETLEKLRAFGCKILSTAENGTILIRG